ncbi:MAG: tetratricopeptide repeat protein, partial [Chitinophagales bacterium]|nr:tetratricopeptide repeat protein [Chitinophagales bacterium]
YYIKLVFPHPLTHDYYYNQIPLIEFSDIKFLSSALITLCLLGIALNQLKRRTLISYGILYFFITFSVVSNLLFSVGIIMNERFLFMPSLGFCILLSAGFHYLYATKRLNTYALSFLAGLVVFLYSVKTIARNTTWKDNLTLFLTDVKYSPNSAKVNTSAGGDLLAASDNEADSIKRRQMIEESISYLSKALSIYPDNHNTLLLMGNAQYKYYKSADAALPFYKKIIELKKGGEFLAYQNAANLLYGEKRYEEAVRYYLGAASLQPNNKDMLVRLSESYAECGKPDSALLYAVHTLQLHPEDPVVLHLIGKIYGKYLNRLAEAIPYLQKAVQLKPAEVAYLEDLGVAYGLSGNYDAAIETMNKILSINPNYKPAYINLSISYRNKGDIKTAEALMNKAMQLP